VILKFLGKNKAKKLCNIIVFLKGKMLANLSKSRMSSFLKETSNYIYNNTEFYIFGSQMPLGGGGALENFTVKIFHEYEIRELRTPCLSFAADPASEVSMAWISTPMS
jgi:hypothetical protein